MMLITFEEKQVEYLLKMLIEKASLDEYRADSAEEKCMELRKRIEEFGKLSQSNPASNGQE